MPALHPSPPYTALADHIAAHATATAALQSWCAARMPTPGAQVCADLVHDYEIDPATYTGRLSVGRGESLRYRAVKLLWGAVAVCEARNWYLPGRLTPEMRTALLTTQTPFGAVIRPLNPRRIPITVEAASDPAILHIRALVVTSAHGTIADVDELYQRVLVAK